VKTSAPTSLGRAKVNDIVLNEDVAVSSEHCRIRPEDGKFVLHDLKSTNGTFVNDRRVTRQPLTEGDTIQVGETYRSSASSTAGADFLNATIPAFRAGPSAWP